MRMEFKLQISANESLRTKFEETVKANPNLHMDLINSFMHAIFLALRLSKDEEVKIDGFRAGEIEPFTPEQIEQMKALEEQAKAQIQAQVESNKKVD